jgi:hypothetical protein
MYGQLDCVKNIPTGLDFSERSPFLTMLKAKFTLSIYTNHDFLTSWLLGALREIEYVFDELNADGIALPSSYGEGADASPNSFLPDHNKKSLLIPPFYRVYGT